MNRDNEAILNECRSDYMAATHPFGTETSYREFARTLFEAIDGRDVGYLSARLHRDNRVSLKIFGLATGCGKLKSNKATNEAIRQWCGPDNYDRWHSWGEVCRLADKQQRDEKDRAAVLAGELRAQVRWHYNGKTVVASTEEFVAARLAEGWEVVAYGAGKARKMYAAIVPSNSPGSLGFIFKKRSLVDWLLTHPGIGQRQPAAVE